MMNDISSEEADFMQSPVRANVNANSTTKQDNEKIEMKIKLEEALQDIDLSQKWKGMYTEMLAYNIQAHEIAAENNNEKKGSARLSLSLSESLIQRDAQNDSKEEVSNKKSLQDAILIAELNEKNATIAKLTEQIGLLESGDSKKTKEKVKQLTEENSRIKQKVDELLLKIKKLSVSGTGDSLPSKFEGMQPHEIEQTIHKLSLIILGKYSAGAFSEKDASFVRSIFGDNIMKTMDTCNEKIRVVDKDCKDMLDLLGLIVYDPSLIY